MCGATLGSYFSLSEPLFPLKSKGNDAGFLCVVLCDLLAERTVQELGIIISTIIQRLYFLCLTKAALVTSSFTILSFLFYCFYLKN